MSEPTFRAGWKVHRPSDTEVWRLHNPAPPYVTVRRGLWQTQILIRAYDEMTDEEFADGVAYAYRESAFEQIQQDLGTLARYLIDHIDGAPVPAAAVPRDEMMAALHRWQRASRDTR